MIAILVYSSFSLAGFAFIGVLWLHDAITGKDNG